MQVAVAVPIVQSSFNGARLAKHTIFDERHHFDLPEAGLPDLSELRSGRSDLTIAVARFQILALLA